MFSSRGQDISREQQSRDFISETNNSGAETSEAAHRQELQVNVSAQGVARRDRRFQAEQAEHEKIRTQCKGMQMHAIARQEDKAKETM